MDGKDADLIVKKFKFLQDIEPKDKRYAYQFRAEIPLDAIRLLYVARERMYVVHLEVIAPDMFGGIAGTKVVIHSTLTKEQIIEVVRVIPDAHRIEQTLEFVKELK
ncbi:MAG: hypothetical protein IPK68_05635 [Bdellovibrionales bacterium]|nr:hypothetical protein [Bdellovibrionales bacterium]